MIRRFCKENPLKRWEIALYIALLAAFLSGAAGARAAKDANLSDKLLRLHVVGASDAEEDQALKLRVRDEALSYLQAPLQGVRTAEAAQRIINEQLPALEAHLHAYTKSQGQEQSVKASLGTEAFPTRAYDTFSLPAGPYTALRIVLGEGEGRNWWCVVFPPLCTSAAMQELGRSEAEALGLSEEDIALITLDDEQYVLKFKVLEWWGSVKNWFVK